MLRPEAMMTETETPRASREEISTGRLTNKNRDCTKNDIGAFGAYSGVVFAPLRFLGLGFDPLAIIGDERAD